MSQGDEKQQTMPEAVASITLHVIAPNDFPALLTYRAPTFDQLLKDMDTGIPSIIKRGYKPDLRKSGNGYARKEPEYVEGRECPKCKAKLVRATRQNGDKFIRCSTNKWDFKTKTASGCDFVEFPK